MLRIVLAVLHLLALGIGLGAIYARGRALHQISASAEAVRRAFAADAWWGIAAMVWISTGLWRALAGTEKATSYYFGNHIFFAKMGLLALVLLLEIYPAVKLVQWRRAAARRALPAPEALSRTGRLLARLSDVQALLVIAMIVAAVMMARGYGARD